MAHTPEKNSIHDPLFVNGVEFRRYMGNYFVSENGEVYSLYTKKLLKHYIDHDGYHRVDVYYKSKCKHVKIHKMVYYCWIGDLPDGLQINHKDDNKDNNSASNLYAGTQIQNIRDAIDNGHREVYNKEVTIMDLSNGNIITFSKIKDLGEYLNHSISTIDNLKRQSWFNMSYKIIHVGDRPW